MVSHPTACERIFDLMMHRTAEQSGGKKTVGVDPTVITARKKIMPELTVYSMY